MAECWLQFAFSKSGSEIDDLEFYYLGPLSSAVLSKALSESKRDCPQISSIPTVVHKRLESSS